MFEWGLCSYGRGYFQFLTKTRPQKNQKRAILHTLQANGGLEPPRPPWLRYWLDVMKSGSSFFFTVITSTVAHFEGFSIPALWVIPL